MLGNEATIQRTSKMNSREKMAAKAFIWGAAVESRIQETYGNKTEVSSYGTDRFYWIDHWNSQVENWGEHVLSAVSGRRLVRWHGFDNLKVIDVFWHAREHAKLPDDGELYFGDGLYAAAKKVGIDPEKKISEIHYSFLVDAVDYF
jgi:hypothetical protein